MKTWKRFLPDVLVVVLFAVISFAYFFVPVTQGKILYRHDASAGVGSAQEMTEYQNRTGEATRWTNAIFGGMPTYQMSPSYQSTDGLSQVMNAYHLWLPDNVWFLFVYLLGFYILLRAFDFRQSLAALGSIMWAFSSYFLIIIAAGHLWKVMALLSLYRPLYGHRLSRSSRSPEATRGFPQGFGRIGCSGIDWYINQSLKPLPHMGVSEREYAWQE